MGKIEWQEKYRIGIDEIDEQHKRLFKLFNDINDIENLNVLSDEVVSALFAIINYAKLHFSCEEDYMERINYTLIEEHKKEHSEFRKKAIELCDRAERQKVTIPKDIIDFLGSWIEEHIIKSDAKISKYVHNIVNNSR